MIRNVEDNEALRWQFVVGLVCLLVLSVYGFLLWIRFEIKESLDRGDKDYLKQTFSRWDRAGRPEDSDPRFPFGGGRKSFVQSNIVVSIDGKVYHTQFAITERKSRRPGTLFVSTNGILLQVLPNGRATVSPVEAMGSHPKH